MPAWTDAEGRFELSGPAGVITVSAEHRGLALRGSAPPVVVDPGETHDGLIIGLNLNGEIAGVVSYEDGEPYQGAVLHLRRSAAGIVDQAMVDEAGRFRFFGLRAGRYDVNVAGPSRCKPAEPSEGALPTLQLREGERLGGVRLVLRGRGLTLRGRVVGSAGEPRGGVAVKVGCDHGSVLDLVDPLRAMTAADGRFRLQVPPSLTPLIIQAYDGVGAVVTQRAVRANASEHLLTLSEASAP